MSAERYWDDFAVGQAFQSASYPLDADKTKAFAVQFDPQPAHVDEAAAASTFFGGLVASGWHTAAVTMRLLVQSDLRIAGGLIGLGLEEVKWPLPTRPGDSLRVVTEVESLRPSKSLPEFGIIKFFVRTLNQNGEVVQTMKANLLVPRKPAGEPAMLA